MATASFSPLTPPPQASQGLSLVDVLVALVVFAIGFTGLAISSQSMQHTLGKSMVRNMEAAYLSMLAAEVNPYRTLVETAYDVPVKTPYALPNGQEAYFTRSVSSEPTSADVKQLNLFLYHDQTDTVPYRRLRRDLRPHTLRYNLGATAQWRDNQGHLWEPWPASTPLYSLVPGSRRNGVTVTGMANSSYTLSQALPNALPYTTGHSHASTLAYTLLATADEPYQLALGFVDTRADTHNYSVSVNGSTVETFNLATYTDATLGRVVTKTYNVTPVLEEGVAVIKVQVTNTTEGAGAHLTSLSLSAS